ncbi:MAG: hypothetical protein LCH63_03475 [Candidatus Melainabacteria bacterium]|jgi:putative membrane protein|uniref:Bestrophin n=1 Tax=Candidatus Obscuribacter phosphatis TaxID=1906157 RepID=A0A8J7P7E3_9BACT|nr:hypothetical protein [Candidatus Obscuribacter phosphatis]MCA0312885.1 hypothetical protein [Candidatus Melainabacteria bacterium]OPZ89250.1 MAG: Bestrophin, RFP-TM, chloride channel [bacterium ADurb.Bin425]
MPPADRNADKQRETESTFTGLDSLHSMNNTAAVNALEATKHKHTFKHAMGIWLHPFTRFHQIPVASRVWVYLAVMTVYCVLVEWVAGRNFNSRVMKEAGAAAFSSAVLGLLLVFRTNTAYDRWWEGRKLWGQLVNDSRNLCLKIYHLHGLPTIEKVRLGELVITFAYSLKHHLRNTKPSRRLPGLQDLPTDKNVNIPVFVANKMFDIVYEWQNKEKIDGFARLQLDYHMRAFMDILGACERIKNSPLALSYRAFMRQGIAINLIALPWYVLPEFELLWSLPLILIGAYFLIGLELIAEDIEEPFGKDGDDLPLDTICNTIQNTVSDILPLKDSLEYTTSLKALRVDPLKESP